MLTTSDLKTLYKNGHTLGSHTWSHADLQKLDYNGINNELAKVEDAMIKILGVRPTYFRPPYGSYNDLVLQVLRDRGYTKLFMWSDDTEDGNRNGEDVPYAKSIYTRIASDFPKPHMVLNHSPYQSSESNSIVVANPPPSRRPGRTLRRPDPHGQGLQARHRRPVHGLEWRVALHLRQRWLGP